MSGRNRLGRALALALLAGAAYGIHAIARGGFARPIRALPCCAMKSGGGATP